MWIGNCVFSLSLLCDHKKVSAAYFHKHKFDYHFLVFLGWNVWWFVIIFVEKKRDLCLECGTDLWILSLLSLLVCYTAKVVLSFSKLKTLKSPVDDVSKNHEPILQDWIHPRVQQHFYTILVKLMVHLVLETQVTPSMNSLLSLCFNLHSWEMVKYWYDFKMFALFLH